MEQFGPEQLAALRWLKNIVTDLGGPYPGQRLDDNEASPRTLHEHRIRLRQEEGEERAAEIDEGIRQLIEREIVQGGTLPGMGHRRDYQIPKWIQVTDTTMQAFQDIRFQGKFLTKTRSVSGIIAAFRRNIPPVRWVASVLRWMRRLSLGG